MSDVSNTIRLHRVLRAPAERVYKAFLDPDALCRWLPPYGYLGKIDRIDPQVGGSYHMSFTNFGTHVRIGEPFYVPIIVAVTAWVALGMRQPEVFRLAIGQSEHKDPPTNEGKVVHER